MLVKTIESSVVDYKSLVAKNTNRQDYKGPVTTEKVLKMANGKTCLSIKSMIFRPTCH